MGAAAAIFGALGGLGNFGEQRAEGTQLAHDEIYKRLVEGQQTQQFNTQQQEAQLRLKAQQQLKPIGQRYNLQGGKQGQYFQDPQSGAISFQVLAGPAEETPLEEKARGMRALGFSEAQIQEATLKSLERTPGTTHIEWIDDANDPKMQNGTITDWMGIPVPGSQQLRRSKPLSGEPTYSIESKTSEVTGLPDGNTRTTYKGAPPPNVTVRPSQQLSPGTTPGAGYSGVDATGKPLPIAQTEPGGFPALVDGSIPLSAIGAPLAPSIPVTAQILEGANTLLQGGEASDLQPGVREYSRTLAGKYGWTGPGWLPPNLPPLDPKTGEIPPIQGVPEDARRIANLAAKNPLETKIPDAKAGKVYGLLDHYFPNWIGKLPPKNIALLLTVDPVITQVDRLRADMRKLRLQNNTTPRYLFIPRLLYGQGFSSDEKSLANDIAKFSVGSLTEAAAAQTGTSRSQWALSLGMEHTPDPWTDSPKLMYDKLGDIRSRLMDMDYYARHPGMPLIFDSTTHRIQKPADPAAVNAPPKSETDPVGTTTAPPPGTKVYDFTQ